MLYIILYVYLYLFRYISCYICLYIQYSTGFASRARPQMVGNYVMHIKWQLFAAKQLSFGGPNSNSRRQKARTHRRRQKDTHILTHKERHTQQRQATVGSRNARCKCGIMPKSSVENVSPQSSKERGGASLM